MLNLHIRSVKNGYIIVQPQAGYLEGVKGNEYVAESIDDLVEVVSNLAYDDKNGALDA